MTNLVFFLEEKSAEALLKGLVPRLLHGIDMDSETNVYYFYFHGNGDLEKNLAMKIRRWEKPNSRFVVLRDQDVADCKSVKEKLINIARNSGDSGRPVLVRVVCRCLESWVLGDLKALAKAYGDSKIENLECKEKYRDPERLHQPDEEIKQIIPRYEKVEGARLVGPLLDIENNNSKSFRVFCRGVRDLVGKQKATSASQ